MRTKTEEKRQAIIDVAAATFGELGFERTSMSEICTRLGGSKATLYNYFPSKEALFLEVMFQASEADFQNTMLALQAGNDDAAQTLRNFGQRFLGLLYSPEVMAVRRLLVSEGGRANIGQRCWDMGPARGNAHQCLFAAGHRAPPAAQCRYRGHAPSSAGAAGSRAAAALHVPAPARPYCAGDCPVHRARRGCLHAGLWHTR
jgi:AcrR family transcriptional regulator